MGQLDQQISVDLDGVADVPQNSLFAALAGLFGILGLLAIVAPFFSVFCLAAIICGGIVLVFAKQWDLSKLSVVTASLSIVVSLFCGLAGLTYQATRDAIMNQKATEVATNYMLALAKGDRTTAIRMVGLPPMVDDSELDGNEISREQKAVRNFLADHAIQEVIKLGDTADWKSTGLQAKERTGIVVEWAIRFIDKNSINPRPYVVAVKMIPPTKNSAESRNQWFVESINQAPL
jgi:hypothetical protein